MNVAGDCLDFCPIALHQRNAHRHCVGTFQRRAASARSQSPLNHLANRGQTQRIALVSWQPPERARIGERRAELLLPKPRPRGHVAYAAFR
jgi:hypothetical protein